MPDLIDIAGGGFAARFLPEWGGRMLSLRHSGAGELLAPVDLDAGFDPLNWPRGGAYPLFPFHNRLPGAAFALAGREIALQGNPNVAGDIMHGPGHHRGWSVTEEDGESLTMALDWVPDADWPFAFRAEQSFALTEAGLRLDLRLRNTGAAAMPGGIGWHPYFAAALDAGTFIDAALESPLGPDALPNAAPVARAPGPLPETTGWTRHMEGWSRAAYDPAPGWRATLTADGLPHLALHRMARYLCIEPVSHRAGALALPEAARAAAGLALIAPGAAIHGVIRLTLDRTE